MKRSAFSPGSGRPGHCLGHYAGALDNWVKLQREYDCYFLIADYQVSDYAGDLPRVRNAVWEVALDWLAVGLDPEGSSFVIESMVPEHAELMTWLAWFMPVGMLERNPTLKAEMEGGNRTPQRRDDKRQVDSRGVLHLPARRSH